MITITTGKTTIEIHQCTGSASHWVDVRIDGDLISASPFPTKKEALRFATNVPANTSQA